MFGIAVAYWAVVNVNRSLPAGVTSIGLLGVPVFGLLCSAAVLGESLDGALLAGMGLIVGIALGCANAALDGGKGRSVSFDIYL